MCPQDDSGIFYGIWTSGVVSVLRENPLGTARSNASLGVTVLVSHVPVQRFGAPSRASTGRKDWGALIGWQGLSGGS